MERSWSALEGNHTFEPVLTPGALIVGSTTGLYALASSNGAVRWRWRTDAEVFSPAVDSGVAFATSRAGHVAALDLREGKVLWQRRLEGWLYTPAVVGSRIVTGGQGGILYALDRDTGATVWTRELGQELVYRPVAVDTGVVVTTFAGAAIRVSAEGKIEWRTRDSSPSFSPAVTGDLLLFGGMDGVLRARDRRTGRLRWRVELSGQLRAPAQGRDGEIAVVSADGTFAVIERSHGAVQMRRMLSGVPVSAPFSPEGQRWRVLERRAGIISWTHASGH